MHLFCQRFEQHDSSKITENGVFQRDSFGISSAFQSRSSGQQADGGKPLRLRKIFKVEAPHSVQEGEPEEILDVLLKGFSLETLPGNIIKFPFRSFGSWFASA